MLNIRNFALTAAVAGSLAVAATALAPRATIVDVAAGNKDFSTLVSLVKKAGLVDTLNSKGPFTVFAPTNKAFEKLPKATLTAVQNDDELLKRVLLYHVVPGKVLAKDVVKVTSANTALEGGKVKVNVKNGKVKINDANVVKTDIAASNGVIHVIDSVLVPPANMSLAANVGTKAKSCSDCTGK
ncbi:MAG: fasciclin domain-containing protein [Fimbriimonadaceae bacterium]|nr:fasciclin domain-containing protein [Fimbriimonadaceae bacterium]QYK59578.1 MAG: fasciclin domain-containing protein [Fimbriimonadaceae bacterium]